MTTPGRAAPPSSVGIEARWLDAGRRVVSEDTVASVLAVVMAVAAVALVARGLTLSESGGILRATPYASLLLAPAVVALAIVRPWTGLVAWVAVMPILNIARVAVTFGPLQVILPTLVIAALAIGLVLERRRVGSVAAPARGASRTTARLELVIWSGIALVVGLSLASTVVAQVPLARSVPIALHGLVEPAILVGLAVALRPTQRQLAALAIAMGASVALASTVNLVRVVVVADHLSGLDEMRYQLARLTYYNVGIFGDMLAMGLPLLIAAFMLRSTMGIPQWGRLLIAAGISVSFVALYLTLSKSGWLGTLASCGLLALVVMPSLRSRAAVLVAGALLASLVVPYPVYILRSVSPGLASDLQGITTAVNSRSSTIDPGTPEGEVSVTERVLATEAGVRMALDHPLLGVGPGGFGAAYAAHYRPAGSTRSLDSAHDLLANVAAEFGLIAAALLAFVLGAALVLGLRTGFRSDPSDAIGRLLPAAVVASLVGFIVVAMTFGVDLYRDYRLINSDVLFAVLLLALAFSLRAPASNGSVPLNAVPA